MEEPRNIIEQFDQDVIEINHLLITLVEKYKLTNGLYAQWCNGKYTIAQDLGELQNDKNNLLDFFILIKNKDGEILTPNGRVKEEEFWENYKKIKPGDSIFKIN